MKQLILLSKVLAMGVFLLLGLSAKATTYYVRPFGNSTAWANVSGATITTLASGNAITAFTTINAAATGADTYYFAPGTYNINGFLQLTTGQFYGGFSGNESSVSDLATRVTSDLDGNGIVEPWEFNNVVTFTSSIANGNYSGTGAAYRMLAVAGGGLGTTGDINGITVYDFQLKASSTFGAIVLGEVTSTPANGTTASYAGKMTQCIVRKLKNAGAATFGIVMMSNQYSTVDKCLIEDNKIDAGSGTVFMNKYGGTVSNSVFRNNTVSAYAPGVYLGNTPTTTADAIVKNCAIYNNTSGTNAGAIRGDGNSISSKGIQVVNCTVVNNKTTLNTSAAIELVNSGVIANTISISDFNSEIRATQTTNYVVNNIYGAPLNGPLYPSTGSNNTSGVADNTFTSLNFKNPTAFQGAVGNDGDGGYDATNFAAIKAANYYITSTSSSAYTTANATLPANFPNKGNVLKTADITITATVPATDINGDTRNTIGAYNYDGTAPTVIITSVSSPTSTSPIPVTFTFTENVTGFSAADVTVGNGTLSAITAVSGKVFTATITPTAAGAVTVDIAAAKVKDSAGNDNTIATQFSITYEIVATAPVGVTTTAVSAITGTTATSGVSYTSNGNSTITSSGVVWSITSTPTIDLSTKTIDGTGSITNLTNGTTYYVRAYATNDIGTTYGSELSFTTKWTIGAAAATADGTVSGGGDFANNATVTLTATAINSKRFVSWTDNGTVVSINRIYTFLATSSRTLIANFGDLQTVYYVRPAGSTKWSNIGAAADQIITTDNFNLAYLANNTPDGTATYYFAAGTYTFVGVAAVGTQLTSGKIYGGFTGDESSIDLNARATSDLDGNGVVEPWELTNATVITGRTGFTYAETGTTDGERLIRIDAGGEVNGVTLTDFKYGLYGGAISVGLPASNPVSPFLGNEGYLKRCIIKKIKSYNGAVMSTNSNSVIDQCLIEDCFGLNYGAIYLNRFGGKVSNSVIRNNFATTQGGAIYAGNGYIATALKAIVSNCSIYNNTATTKGGAISSKSIDATSGGVEILNSTIVNNVTGTNASVEFDGPGLIVNSIVTGDAKADLYASSTTNYVGGVVYNTLASSSLALTATNTSSGKAVADLNFERPTATAGYLGLTVNQAYTDMRAAKFNLTNSSSPAITTTAGAVTSYNSVAVYSSVPTTDILSVSRTGSMTLGAYQFGGSVTWDGSAWSNSSGPTSSLEAIIDGSYSGAEFTAKKLTVNANKSLTVNSGTNVTVQNEVVNNGSLTNAGTLTNSGTITNTGTITNSGTIDNSTGTIVNTGTLINTSSASATGYLLSSASTANVTQERYLTSNQRGWRLLSNPVTTTTFGTLASGSTTPFTLGASASGAYDSATNTWSNGVDSDNMFSQNAYKVFVKGISSEVTASSYSVTSPSNVTVSVTGTASNSVPTAITTTAGKYYLVANPYTAPVSVLSIIGASTGLTNSVSYYNPSKAATDPKIKAGGYDAVTVSGTVGSATDVVLPPMGAIFVQASSAGTINIPKSAIYTGIVSGTNVYNHKTANSKAVAPSVLTLNVASNGVDFDKLKFQFKEVGALGSNIDFGKLPNSILNLYSIDGTNNMAISELELKEQTIPLGITSTALQGFTFNIAENSIPSGFEASLVDNLLNIQTVLTTGTNYNFNLNATATSQGTSRFAITLKATTALSVKENVLDTKIVMWPNPAQNQVYILNNILEGDTTIKVYSISGKLIHCENTVAGSTTTINTSGWATGVYLLNVTNNGNKTTKQLIIQ